MLASAIAIASLSNNSLLHVVNLVSFKHFKKLCRIFIEERNLDNFMVFQVLPMPIIKVNYFEIKDAPVSLGVFP